MPEDPFVTYLNSQHYNPISLPRAQFDPLLVLIGTSKTELEPFGTLSDLVVAGTPLPAVSPDDTAPAFSDRRGKAADAKAGVDLFGRLLAALGGPSAGASAAYASASHFEYAFSSVLHNYVFPARLLSVFEGPNLNDSILSAAAAYPYVYLVTDTLKSNQFGIAAYDGSGAALNVDAGAIQEQLGVHAGVKVASGSGNLVTYTGDAHLRFAFRAMRLTYDPLKKHVTLAFDSSAMVSKAVADVPHLSLDAFEVLAPGEAIAVGRG